MDENKGEGPEDLSLKKLPLRRLFGGVLKYFICKMTNHGLE